MMQEPALILIGSYLVALVMRVERIPVTGETLHATHFHETYGGKGSDMAVQAARLGTRVYFLGCVGNDSFGQAFIQLMQQEGVNLDYLSQRDDMPTGAGFIIKSTTGQNIITIDSGANQLFSGADVDRALALLTPSSVMLIQLEIPLETALYAARRGQEKGCTVIFNPAPACDLRIYDLSAVSILTPNETEARVCLGLDPQDPTDHFIIAQQLLALGCQTVVMTLGEQGALVVTAEEHYLVPAGPDLHILDSNGAGDSFNAALASALLEQRPLPEAVRFANAVAGLSCTCWDTVPSYHQRAEVEAYLQNWQ